MNSAVRGVISNLSTGDEAISADGMKSQPIMSDSAHTIKPAGIETRKESINAKTT